ncbi:dihydroneopterin aldolase, partial [Campylobacter coli]|nr:dihydroneopterin aldolase [Campylobacter coli]EAH6220107.1 dihydroneopterin aldolase [Campylobacter coli]EAI8799038.1 dihydroneopterin aldolase [Campylobacter coli]EAJ0005399.1 dihydroneopterin aldolase [Campylobacter coli]EAJ1360431.1 dihydroneopterin aldolase [Campylobacter coli]
MQSHINIKMQFKCIIGILKFERKKKQKVCIYLTAKANDFLDYAKVSKRIKKY